VVVVIEFLSGGDLEPFIGTPRAVVAPVNFSVFHSSSGIYFVICILYELRRRHFSNSYSKLNVTSEQSFLLVAHCGD
jgi:hypothetical protein